MIQDDTDFWFAVGLLMGFVLIGFGIALITV